jgi:hypothetical protein
MMFASPFIMAVAGLSNPGNVKGLYAWGAAAGAAYVAGARSIAQQTTATIARPMAAAVLNKPRPCQD